LPHGGLRADGRLFPTGTRCGYHSRPPVSCHVAASILQRLSGLPWVADLRDPWAHPYLEPTPAQLRINHVLEKSTLSNSAALTTVSGPLARSLEGRHGPSPGGTVSIPNGFDPADYGHRVEVPDGRLVFTYTGSLFGLKRDPGAVLQVTEELIDEGRIAAEQVVFRFYGPREPRLREQRDRLKYPGIVSEEGVVSRGTAIRHQQESTALLVLFWDSPYATKGYGGKVLEYLGARRPILAWSPAGGIVGELLERTGAGAAVSNRDELRALLGEWFDEFRRTGGLAYRGKAPEVQRYSWKVLAGQFAALFESVAGG
jgi:glycosyltransferase involved in cell wall biosynthesis